MVTLNGFHVCGLGRLPHTIQRKACIGKKDLDGPFLPHSPVPDQGNTCMLQERREWVRRTPFDSRCTIRWKSEKRAESGISMMLDAAAGNVDTTKAGEFLTFARDALGLGGSA